MNRKIELLEKHILGLEQELFFHEITWKFMQPVVLTVKTFII